MTQKLISKRSWQDIELPFIGPDTAQFSTLDDLERLDPDRGWVCISLRLPSYGFRGRSETIMLLELLLNHEGLSYASQADWDWHTANGTIARLTDLIDQHLIPKGRRA